MDKELLKKFANNVSYRPYRSALLGENPSEGLIKNALRYCINRSVRDEVLAALNNVEPVVEKPAKAAKQQEPEFREVAVETPFEGVEVTKVVEKEAEEPAAEIEIEAVPETPKKTTKKKSTKKE